MCPWPICVQHWGRSGERICSFEYILPRPETVGDACGHGRRDAQHLVDADEIVIDNVDRQRVDMVLQLHAGRVGQPREAHVGHSGCEAQTLDDRRQDVRRVRQPLYASWLGGDDFARAVSCLALGQWLAEDFYQLGQIDIGAEGVLDRFELCLVANRNCCS